MAVKLALNSKEDYNLDQEVCLVLFLIYLFNTKKKENIQLASIDVFHFVFIFN